MYQKIANNHGWTKHPNKHGWTSSRNQQRYGMYYENSISEINFQKWNALQKRLRQLRKQLIKLGKVPNRPSQNISILNYLVSFVNIITKFYDNGLIDVAPQNLSQSCREFNDSITYITRRKNAPCAYSNRSLPGEDVTVNNLFLGAANLIKPNADDCISEVVPNCFDGGNLTEFYNGNLYSIFVRPHPVSAWMNNKVFDIYGRKASLNFSEVTNILSTLSTNLLSTIDTLLN